MRTGKYHDGKEMIPIASFTESVKVVAAATTLTALTTGAITATG